MRLSASLAAAGLLALCAASLALGVHMSSRAASLRERAREAERARAKAMGLLAASEASRASLRREAASLREELRKIRRTFPAASIREVTRWKTREIEIPCDHAAEGRDGVSRGARPANPRGEHGDAASSAMGSAIRIRLVGHEARLETRAGTLMAIGRVDVWQTWPSPERLLASEPLRFALHDIAAPVRPERWAAGPMVAVSTDGVLLGGIIAGPSFRVLGFRARPAGILLAGHRDAVIGAAALVSW